MPSGIRSDVGNSGGRENDGSHKYRLVLYRHYNPPKDKNNEQSSGARRMNQYSQAVIHKVLSMKEVPSLTMAMNGEWIIDQDPAASVAGEGESHVTPREGVQLTPHIGLRITRRQKTEWDFSALELTLVSDTCTATDMVQYVLELHEEHTRHLNDELGTKTYFFDQKENSDYRGNPYEGTMNATEKRKYDIMNAPKCLSFQKHAFQSNKTFDNLCGPEIKLIAERVKFFVQNREWYDRKGVPYHLGFMLSGTSGTGKSSAIKAVAQYTRRHLINVNFANIRTMTQLKKLFFSEEIDVFTDEDCAETTKLLIPIDKRIYVLEELDALGATVIDRKITRSAAVGGGNGDDPSVMAANAARGTQSNLHDEITLGKLLQVMDGNMEMPGRMLIMTSNYPDCIDEALMRPGRVDVHVKFGAASRATVGEIYHKLHDRPLSKKMLADVPDGVISPAEAMEVVFRNFGKPDMVVQELQKRAALIDEVRRQRDKAAQDQLARLACMIDEEEQLEQLEQQEEQQRQQRQNSPAGVGGH